MIIIFSIICCLLYILASYYYSQNKKYRILYKTLYLRYQHISDIEEAKRNLEYELASVRGEKNRLHAEYETMHQAYIRLCTQIKAVEEDMNIKTVGLYTPQFQYTDTEEYRLSLTVNYTQQQNIIARQEAAVCSKQWATAHEESLLANQLQLILLAFNGICESIIAKSHWDNASVMENRILKAFNDLNQFGQPFQIAITMEYLHLKIQQLHLTHEYALKWQENQASLFLNPAQDA